MWSTHSLDGKIDSLRLADGPLGLIKDDERLETLEKINNYLINNDKKQLKKIKEGIHKNLIYVLLQQ